MAGAPKEWLIPFLLLRIRDGLSYGHELNGWVEEIGFDRMRAGETYRTLWWMEQDGMVLRDRDGSGFKAPLRRYEITEAGEDYLKSWADSLAEYRDEVDLFFRLHARRSSARGVAGEG